MERPYKKRKLILSVLLAMDNAAFFLLPLSLCLKVSRNIVTRDLDEP